jgi:hypothetical protein
MEEAGMVTTSKRTNGPGRASKTYRVASEEQKAKMSNLARRAFRTLDVYGPAENAEELCEGPAGEYLEGPGHLVTGAMPVERGPSRANVSRPFAPAFPLGDEDHLNLLAGKTPEFDYGFAGPGASSF